MKSFHLLTINDSKYYLTESNKEYLCSLKEEIHNSEITISISKWAKEQHFYFRTDSLKEILPKDLESLPQIITIEEKIHAYYTSRGCWLESRLNHLVILNPKIISYEYDEYENRGGLVKKIKPSKISIKQREGTSKKLMSLKEDKQEYNTGNIIINLTFTKIIKTNNIESTIRDIKLDTLL